MQEYRLLVLVLHEYTKTEMIKLHSPIVISQNYAKESHLLV
jgi:hypothetical protein